MNSPEKICSKCQAPLTELKGGLWCCPQCGFEGEPAKAATTRNEQRNFWIIFFMPWVMALACLLLGSIGGFNSVLGVLMGIGSVVATLYSSVYCGVWLGRHFFVSKIARFAFGTLFIFGIGFVNVTISTVGCSSGMIGHVPSH